MIVEYALENKNIPKLFYEQAVSRRGTKMVSLCDVCRQYRYEALPFPGSVRKNVSTVQRTEAKRGQQGVSVTVM